MAIKVDMSDYRAVVPSELGIPQGGWSENLSVQHLSGYVDRFSTKNPLMGWTSRDYVDIRDQLRDGEEKTRKRFVRARSDIMSEAQATGEIDGSMKRTAETIKWMDDHMADVRVGRPLYRGLGRVMDLNVGDEIDTNKAFMSTSLDPGIAAKTFSKGKTLFVIHGIDGSFRGIPVNPKEQEVILDRHTRFRVESVQDNVIIPHGKVGRGKKPVQRMVVLQVLPQEPKSEPINPDASVAGRGGLDLGDMPTTASNGRDEAITQAVASYRKGQPTRSSEDASAVPSKSMEYQGMPKAPARVSKRGRGGHEFRKR